jgi:hypothetical protein
MLPLIATRIAFDQGADRPRRPAAVAKECGTAIDYRIGTMMELPRAALMVGEIAETAGVHYAVLAAAIRPPQAAMGCRARSL